MKKEILQNDEDSYEVKYIISKNKFAHYYYDKIYNIRSLEFWKKNFFHRQCNIGPKYKCKELIEYMENDTYHNLYGYAYIDKKYNKKEYWIYDKEYTKDQFLNYISLYNNLSYKRIY